MLTRIMVLVHRGLDPFQPCPHASFAVPVARVLVFPRVFWTVNATRKMKGGGTMPLCPGGLQSPRFFASKRSTPFDSRVNHYIDYRDTSLGATASLCSHAWGQDEATVATQSGIQVRG